MDALTIDHARASVRLSASQLGRRTAIEAIHHRVVRQCLEAAWAGEGSGDALICVRSLEIELRLDPRALGTAAEQRWSTALIDELRRTLREADPRRVVVYRSPSAALVDMGRSLAREDLRRAWAWGQLGFVDPRERREIERAPGLRVEDVGAARAAALTLAGGHRSWARALSTRPELIVGVLAQLARVPEVLVRLLRSSAATTWIELSAAALRVHGIDDPVDPVDPIDPIAPIAPIDPTGSPDPTIEPLARLRELAASSPIARALASAQLDASSTRALMLLAVLDAAPMTARRVLSKRSAARREIATTQHAHADPDPRAPTPTEPRAQTPTEPRLEPWREPPLDTRARGFSEWGGLALTLAIIRDAQQWSALDELAIDLDLEFRVVLHGFGRALAANQIAATDPALLAFIGLPPDAPPPASLDPERERDLAAALETPRARLLAALHDRLGTRHGPEQQLAQLLRRRVEVLGEPGWIELHFDLRDVDLEVRRAGLDLHPNWIPELGVVMRFFYA